MSSISAALFVVDCNLSVITGYASITLVGSAEVSRCYSANSQNNNSCFYTSGSVLSWDEARQFCVKKNSTLPIISDKSADDAFQQFIERDANTAIRGEPVWINARARPINSTVSWHWIDGRQSGSYTVVKLLRNRWGIRSLSLKLDFYTFVRLKTYFTQA